MTFDASAPGWASFLEQGGELSLEGSLLTVSLRDALATFDMTSRTDRSLLLPLASHARALWRRALRAPAPPPALARPALTALAGPLLPVGWYDRGTALAVAGCSSSRCSCWAACRACSK